MIFMKRLLVLQFMVIVLLITCTSTLWRKTTHLISIMGEKEEKIFQLKSKVNTLDYVIKIKNYDEKQCDCDKDNIGLVGLLDTIKDEDDKDNEPLYIYDIALSEDLQRYTWETCNTYDFPYKIALAVMHAESSYIESAINYNKTCYGLMQIHQINHKWLKEKLDVSDFLDGKDNILSGVYMLGQLMDKYDDIHKVLMAYNCGEGSAQRQWDQGYNSSRYSRGIVEYAENLKLVGG